MFSCCRCGNPKTKDGKPSKKSKQKVNKVTSEGEEEENNTTSPVPTSSSTSPPLDGQQNSSFSSFTSPLTSPGSTGELEPANEEVLVNGQVSSSSHHKARLASPSPVDGDQEHDTNLASSPSSSCEEQEVVGIGEPQEINQTQDITNGIEKLDGRGGCNHKLTSFLLSFLTFFFYSCHVSVSFIIFLFYDLVLLFYGGILREKHRLCELSCGLK